MYIIICAILYASITRQLPVNAKQRVKGTDLQPPSRLGVPISRQREKGLMKGLEILQKDRWKDGCELYRVLYGKANEEENKHQGKKNVLKKEKSFDMLGTGIHRSDILTITFLDNAKRKSKQYWDVSEKRNGSVLAWAERQKDGYDFYLAGDGGVVANPDSSDLFQNCSRMVKICFQNSLDTSQVRNMSGLFRNCTNLKELDLRCFDTSMVTNMSEMFSGCSSLQQLDITSFYTGNVVDMRGMFLGCGQMNRLDISGFDTAGVTDMSYMFSGCTSLNVLDVSKFNTSRVTDMRSMFNGCCCLNSLDVSSFNTTQVADVSYMFSGCINLKLELSEE